MAAKTESANRSDNDMDALKKEIEALKKDILRLTETLGKVGEQKIRSSVEDVREKIEARIPEAQLEQLEALKKQSEEAMETIRQQQKEHPLGTLLVAAGIGFLLGRVLGGKN